MIKTERFCDFCGNKVDRFAAKVITIPRGANPANVNDSTAGLETCQDCLDALFEIKKRRIAKAVSHGS